MRPIIIMSILSLAGSAACADHAAPAQEAEESALDTDQRRSRATTIREAAASAGLYNGALLAGIAQVETGLAHCWAEAPWACQGPPSSSCDGGPVIAGAGDGPCAWRQGGLGMFQFDSGTHDDTLHTYGDAIVTLEGNVAQVVPFLITRAIQSVDGVDTAAGALAWMNAIPIEDGHPDFERWIYFVSWRYNGCMGCPAQEARYRAATHRMYQELGPAFWAAARPLSQTTCGDLADGLGWQAPLCESGGNAACEGRGPTTVDCDHCCDGDLLVAGLPAPATVSCGDWADMLGYATPACEWNDNGVCAGRGPATLDCQRCCDTSAPARSLSLQASEAVACGDWADANDYADARCEWNGNGACAGRGPTTVDCEHCCAP